MIYRFLNLVWRITALTILALPMPASAQQTRMTATLAIGGEGLNYLPAIVAREKMYFQSEGLDLKTITTSGGAEAAAAVLSGSADFADGIHFVYRAQLQNQDLVTVANAQDQFGLMFAVSKKALQKAGLKKGDSPEGVVKGLKGLRIGISSAGSSTDLVTRGLFNRSGMNAEKDATLIPLGNGGAMLAAMETDQIDAFVYISPYPETAVARGVAEIMVNLQAGEVKELSGYPYTAYFTSRKNTTDRAQVVQAFVNAIYKGELYIHAYPEKTVEIARKVFKDMNPQVLALATHNTMFAIPENPIISLAQVEVSLDWLKHKPEERAKLPFSKVVDNRFAIKAVESISRVAE